MIPLPIGSLCGAAARVPADRQATVPHCRPATSEIGRRTSRDTDNHNHRPPNLRRTQPGRPGERLQIATTSPAPQHVADDVDPDRGKVQAGKAERVVGRDQRDVRSYVRHDWPPHSLEEAGYRQSVNPPQRYDKYDEL
jgi:hypothetical protein